MDEHSLLLPREHLRKLVGAASPDAALLYLHLTLGGDLLGAEAQLRLPRMRIDIALAALRQLGLYEEPRQMAVRQNPPTYCEEDLVREMARGQEFGLLVGEVQRRLGRILSTEELKILLSFTDYLGLPSEVVGMLITYCIQRGKSRGNLRPPSIRTIEKEAYFWADHGIDTLEEAAGYLQTQLEKQSRAGRIQRMLQLGDRKLTPGEEKYILAWLDMGFGEAEIQLAYEKTCLNTGSMKWPYCNSILKSWHEQGLHRAADIVAGDQRPAAKPRVPMGSAGQGELGDLEKLAIERLKREFEKEA